MIRAGVVLLALSVLPAFARAQTGAEPPTEPPLTAPTPSGGAAPPTTEPPITAPPSGPDGAPLTAPPTVTEPPHAAAVAAPPTAIDVQNAPIADAQTEDAQAVTPPVEETAPWRSNVGFHTQIGPVVLSPTRSGDTWGFGLEVGLRYGFAGLASAVYRKTGLVLVVAPGVRVAGYSQMQRNIGDLLLTSRITLLLGPVAPFVEGGAGPGGMTNPSSGGVGLLVGGGVMLHLSPAFALGVRAGYETITSTRFRVVSLGPMLQFGF